MEEKIKAVWPDGKEKVYDVNDEYIKKLDILLTLEEGSGYVSVDDIDFYLIRD